MIMYPLTTEKTSLLASEGKYVFRVSPRQNKLGVAKEIEHLYKVRVSDVHILWTKGKKRRVGRIEGEKRGFKKAIITLKKGQKIEM